MSIHIYSRVCVAMTSAAVGPGDEPGLPSTVRLCSQNQTRWLRSAGCTPGRTFQCRKASQWRPASGSYTKGGKWSIVSDGWKNNVVEAHCYALQCRRVDCEQIRSRINQQLIAGLFSHGGLQFCTQLTKAIVACSWLFTQLLFTSITYIITWTIYCTLPVE